MNDDWYSLTANATFTYSDIVAKEFIAEVKVWGMHDRTLGLPDNNKNDAWNTAGIALGATDYNRVVIGAQGNGFKLYRNNWSSDRWSAGKDLSSHDMFKAYGQMNNVTAVNDGKVTTIKVVKTAEAGLCSARQYSLRQADGGRQGLRRVRQLDRLCASRRVERNHER